MAEAFRRPTEDLAFRRPRGELVRRPSAEIPSEPRATAGLAGTEPARGFKKVGGLTYEQAVNPRTWAGREPRRDGPTGSTPVAQWFSTARRQGMSR